VLPRPTPDPVASTRGTETALVADATTAVTTAGPLETRSTNWLAVIVMGMAQATVTVAMPAASHVIEKVPDVDVTSAPKST
jgi:hypothetical protein